MKALALPPPCTTSWLLHPAVLLVWEMTCQLCASSDFILCVPLLHASSPLCVPSSGLLSLSTHCFRMFSPQLSRTPCRYPFGMGEWCGPSCLTYLPSSDFKTYQTCASFSQGLLSAKAGPMTCHVMVLNGFVIHFLNRISREMHGKSQGNPGIASSGTSNTS